MDRVKYLVFFLLLISLGQNVLAQDQELVVWLHNGENIHFKLTEEPETRYSDGSLIISSKSLSVTYPLGDVAKYTYEGRGTGVESADKNLFVHQNGNTLELRNLKKGTCLEVFSPDGKLMRKQDIKAGRIARVNLEPLPAGIYVIKLDDTTFKFMKK